MCCHSKQGAPIFCCCAGDVATVVQVQLIVLCPRFNGYAAAQPGCSITFTNFSSTAVAATPVNYDGYAICLVGSAKVLSNAQHAG